MLLFIIVYILVDYSQYDYLCNNLVCQKIVFAIQNIFTCRSDYSMNIVNIKNIYTYILYIVGWNKNYVCIILGVASPFVVIKLSLYTPCELKGSEVIGRVILIL